MSPESRELFRICLLQMLRTMDERGLPVRNLVTGARLAGFDDVNEDHVRGELAYMHDKGLVEKVEKLVSPELAVWRIHAKGTDFLAIRKL